MEACGYESGNLFINMGVYIVIFIFLILFLIIIIMLRIIKKFRDNMNKVLALISRKIFWNMIIKTVTLSYIEFAISLTIST